MGNFSSFEYEAGIDEAGRGALAGPVVAAAVILPKSFSHPLLNDSKKLTAKQRELLEPIIKDHCIDYAISFKNNDYIDTHNILKSNIEAMHECMSKLKKIDFALIDGNYFKPFANIQFQTIVKGDSKYANIAAASILAKTYRDQLMNNLSQEFPNYEWHKNKGYGTANHIKNMEKYGLSMYHRKSFKLKKNLQITLW